MRKSTMSNPIARTRLVRRRLALTAAALLATLLSGCNTANTISPAGPAGTTGEIPFHQIVTNGWLQYKANVKAVREDVVNGDMKRVAIDVYSDQLTTQRFSYRFDWVDAAGMPVSSPSTSLASVTIKPKETIVLTSVAPSPKAAQWRLTLLDAQY